jgi:hypothetical protein
MFHYLPLYLTDMVGRRTGRDGVQFCLFLFILVITVPSSAGPGSRHGRHCDASAGGGTGGGDDGSGGSSGGSDGARATAPVLALAQKLLAFPKFGTPWAGTSSSAGGSAGGTAAMTNSTGCW